MDPKSKRELERITREKERRLEIIQAAKIVFYSKGIDNSKMTDIAGEAEVGVASVYRYFKTKSELVIDTGLDYYKCIFNTVQFSHDFEKKAGIDQLTEILDWLISLFYSAPDFLCFLQQFDFYFFNKENYHPRLDEFEKEVMGYFSLFTDSINKGMKDGTIRNDINEIDITTLIVRTFVYLQQVDLTRSHILSIDEKISIEKQLQILKEMILCYLKK